MTDTYTQLFNSYAHDLQWRLKNSEKEILDQLVETIPMSNEHQIDLADRLAALRSRCCAESFALGVQLGMRLIGEYGFSPTTAS